MGKGTGDRGQGTGNREQGKGVSASPGGDLQANCWGNLTNCEEVEIFLAASCCRNQDKLRHL